MSFRRERWVLTVVIMLGLSLVFVTVLGSTLGDKASLTSTAVPSKLVATVTLAPFDPAFYGLPEVIAGYKILAVETSENVACMQPDTINLVLQSSQPNLDAFLKNNPGGNVEDEVKKLNIKQPKHLAFQYVGPGITKGSILYLLKNWDPRVMKTCIRLGPIPTFEPTLELGINN